MSCLQVRVVPSPNGPHGGGFIASITLGGIFKIRIRPPWAVDTDVASHVDVRTAVRLAHNSHHSDLEKAQNEN